MSKQFTRRLFIFITLFLAPLFAWSEWWNSAVFYEIFVRSFQDSNNDGIGDIPGLISRLDYLNDGVAGKGNDLEIDALWLTPIFKSGSYHGYDTEDYYNINPEYGNMEDFERLVKEAHKRGIKIILDLVVNHTSQNHPWFIASLANQAPYSDYYVWQKQLPSGPWAKPWGGGDAHSVWNYRADRGEYYYTAFSSRMPDLNLKNPQVKNEIYNIADFWLLKGVDGFRLDAARYLIETGPGPRQSDTRETLDFWRKFAAHVKSVKPETFLIGEIWTSNEKVSKYYLRGKGLDMCFNFELADKIPAAARFGNMDGISEVFKNLKKWRVPFSFYAPFLSNHDTIRSLNVMNNNILNSRIAAVMLLTLPGSPFIYYGEEIGMVQENGGSDLLKRAPMYWDTNFNAGFSKASQLWQPQVPQRPEGYVLYQQNNTDTLFRLYRKMIQIRKKNPVLTDGSLDFLDTGNDKVIAYRRFNKTEEIIIMLNGSKSTQEITYAPWMKGVFQDLLSQKEVTLEKDDMLLDEKAIFVLKRKIK